MRVDADTEATFVAGVRGRDSHIALWSRGSAPRGDGSVSIAFADGVRSVPADMVSIADAIPTLAGLSAATETTSSLWALAIGTRLALDLISRGRLLPAIAPDGTDTWRLGPLDTADRNRLDQLAEALPAAAYATVPPGTRPARGATVRSGVAPSPDDMHSPGTTPSSDDVPSSDSPNDAHAPGTTPSSGTTHAPGTAPSLDDMHSPGTTPSSDDAPSSPSPDDTSTDGVSIPTPAATVTALIDAVADAFARTASAPMASGSAAYADPHGATDVTSTESWLQSVTAGVVGQSVAGLRIDMPRTDNGDVRAVVQVQSRLDPSLVLDAETLWSAPTTVLSRFGPEVETDLLLTLRRAARAWAPIERLLAMATPDEIDLDDDEVEELFGPIADDLAAAGLPVLWPSDVFRPLEMRPVLDTPTPESVSGGRLDLSALGEIRWHATVDGGELSESELLELSQAKRPVVRLRGRWVRADPERLARLNQRQSLSAGEVLAAAATGTIDLDGTPVAAQLSSPLEALASRLATIDATTQRPAPPDLHADLRPYQERGLAWLAEMADLGLGGVLADDMGLGKTIQILALHLLRHGDTVGAGRSKGHLTVVAEGSDRGPTLVICPATLLGNWEREANRFAPDVPVIRYHGAGRSLDDVTANSIVVATYGVARRDHAELSSIDWDLVVADEAQAIKNPFSRTAVSMRQIDSQCRFALTGTPVENRLSDLWALLDWTTPGLLGPLDPFQRNLATPIERDKDPEATQRLASVVRPFLLRRRKSDPEIAPDLPPKTETDRFVGITVEQATLYKAVVDEMLDDVEESDDAFTRQGRVLKLLTALKQICNHPAQYLDQDGPLAGRSGKLDAATDLLSVIVDEGESALVFTQYVRMGQILGEHLAAHGIESQFLHGSVPVRRREEMVDAFQAGEPRVFVISLGAGGTGLNLTRATHVVHYDRWWNPAVEDQASDRAWRIGQDRPVQVHRMICEGTLEDRIAKVLEEKRLLADSIVGGGEAWVSQLSNDELAALVTLADGV